MSIGALMKSMTFTELVNLEKGIYKNQSKNLQGIVTSVEKVVVCLGELQKSSFFKLANPLGYFVLTDFRVLAYDGGFTNVMLDKIVKIEVRSLILAAELLIALPEYSSEPVGQISYSANGINYCNVLPLQSDIAYVNRLAGEMNKYISEAKIRLRSNTITVNTTQQGINNIAGQLETLASLYNSGAITQSEYNKAKEKLLSS
jgi:hypothetical protein